MPWRRQLAKNKVGLWHIAVGAGRPFVSRTVMDNGFKRHISCISLRFALFAHSPFFEIVLCGRCKLMHVRCILMHVCKPR